jgi:hypothetical protein
MNKDNLNILHYANDRKRKQQAQPLLGKQTEIPESGDTY